MSEAFPKPQSAEETLNDALASLEESRFAFACFVDAFKRYLGKLEEEKKK